MADNMQSKFLVGKKVYLRPLEEKDLSFICRWANDPEIRKLTGEVLPMSMKNARDFYEKVHIDKNRIWVSVVLHEKDRLIGEAGLLRMFHPWRTTDLTLIIGEKDCWDKGYGQEALFLLLNYAFGYLHFHRVSVGVVGFNERALHFYEHAGFIREGIQRDGYYYDHRYSDFIMMSILEHEFREKHHI
ncbi:MAG: GNAT family N-acetyltransferase [Theionarchaea archaeon]|nr:GNAT family N-acetyltransferase [Theionarchaea archaeon]